MDFKYRFEGLDRYDTPESLPVATGFRLTGRSRWYFYFDNFRTFCIAGLAGRRGKLDAATQMALSNRNIDLVERCGGRIHLRGLNHLRELDGRPAVLVGNHMSLLECGLLHAVIRPYVDFSFVVKESLMKVPYFGDILRSLGAIPVTRSNPRDDLRKVLADGRKILESGRSLIIFPQSTRSEYFRPDHFNTIGVKLAKSAGVPVLPFALKTDLVATGSLVRDLGPVRPERAVWFEFAPALTITGNGSEQQQTVVDFIAARVNAWRAAEGLATAPPAPTPGDAE